MITKHRRVALEAAGLNGIDFVEVADALQTVLRVHFINNVAIGNFSATPKIVGGETIPSVPVLPFPAGSPPWSTEDDHLVLTLNVAAPGDFSLYTLKLAADAIDPFFGSVTFSFKAGCPSDVDCAAPSPDCPPEAALAPQIDYLAKDFLSFRQALLDYSTQYYPNWQERSEADFGMMFLEALSAFGDDFSYLQDRVAREATLTTATERRSVTRHARLVDYEPGRTLSARTTLQFDVAPGAPATAPDGLAVIASGADGVRVVFETGDGLNSSAKPIPIDPRWNRNPGIRAYWFDDSARCLPAGATSMFVGGHGYDFKAGQTLLLETEGERPLDPPLRQLVRLLGFGDSAGPWAIESVDKVFAIPGSPGPVPVPITKITWIGDDALTASRDLQRTKVIGNIVPATQGETMVEAFAIATGAVPVAGTPPLAIERSGPSPTGGADDRPVVRLYTLANAPVAWLTPMTGAGTPAPEIQVMSEDWQWDWQQSLISARPTDAAFTLDAASFRALPPNADGSVAYEYDGDAGDTIRFGDGVFGINPEPGRTFTVRYRVGGGAAGNVAANAINQIDPTTPAAKGVVAVTNPFAAVGGANAETLLSVLRNAPQAFRSTLMRVVTTEDYVTVAARLAWVKRAGCARRWTGSWLTTFTTPEPAQSEAVLAKQRLQLVALLDRMRMAGTECYVPDPNYVSIDLRIIVCAAPNAFAAQVQLAVIAALAPAGASTSHAFFAVGRYGFGEPLYRGDLEAAIQTVPGVAGVTRITYRLRDRWRDFRDMGDSVAVGTAQILRCDNDKSRPAAGALSVTAMGGR